MAGKKRSSNNSKVPLIAGLIGVALAACVVLAMLFNKSDEPKKIEVLSEPITVASVKNSLADFRGKVVILDIWATWCGPCRVEIPGFIELQKKYQEQGLEVIGVSIDPITQTGAKAVAPFMKSYNINYHIWMVTDQQAMTGYEPGSGIPTTYIINRDGQIVQKHVGAKPMSVFENDIKKLL